MEYVDGWSTTRARKEQNKGRSQEVGTGVSRSPSYPPLLSARCFRQLLSPVIWDGKTCGLGDMAGEGLISRKGAQSFLVLRFCNSEPGLPVSLARPETAKGFASLLSRGAAAHGTGPATARALSCTRPHPAEARGAGTRQECEFWKWTVHDFTASSAPRRRHTGFSTRLRAARSARLSPSPYGLRPTQGSFGCKEKSTPVG